MMNTCWSEVNRLELFMVFTICDSKLNNYLTLMHVTLITWIKNQLITWKWPNIFWYSAEWYSIFASIFASKLNTSTSNHQFFALPTIGLRLQRFAIRLNDKSRSRTPLCRNLPRTIHYLHRIEFWSDFLSICSAIVFPSLHWFCYVIYD